MLLAKRARYVLMSQRIPKIFLASRANIFSVWVWISSIYSFPLLPFLSPSPSTLSSSPSHIRTIKDCWRGYLAIEVKEKHSLITCPGRDDKGGKCKMAVDDSAVLLLLSPEEKAKYTDAMIQSFIDANESYKVRHRFYFLCLTLGNEKLDYFFHYRALFLFIVIFMVFYSGVQQKNASMQYL
jgi:hypothetical protein